jgi:CDP-diacylglycerol pyrophosphatase
MKQQDLHLHIVCIDEKKRDNVDYNAVGMGKREKGTFAKLVYNFGKRQHYS